MLAYTGSGGGTKGGATETPKIQESKRQGLL